MTEKANNLDGTTWTKYSISIWSDIRKSKDEVDLKHPAIFPHQLVSRSEMGHTGIVFEVSSNYIELTKERLARKTI